MAKCTKCGTYIVKGKKCRKCDTKDFLNTLPDDLEGYFLGNDPRKHKDYKWLSGK